MLPGWPQCTSQPGRSHVFTSSTKGANTADTGSAVPQSKPNRRRKHKPSAPTTEHTHEEKESETRARNKALRTSREQRGEQERVWCQRVEPRPGCRPPPLAVASRRKARLLLLSGHRLKPQRRQCPAAGTRRRWRRERATEEGARPEEKRARHRRGRHGHHPSRRAHYLLGYRPVTRSFDLAVVRCPTTRRDRPKGAGGAVAASRGGERGCGERGVETARPSEVR